MPPTTRPPASPLLAIGALAGPLFIVVYTIEDLTRPGFSPLRDQVSQLALGDWGWVQAVNFFVTGLLVVALAAGLRRVLRPRGLVPSLIALAGLGLVAATFFATSPANGYPPGARAAMTAHGQVHDLAAGLFYTCLSAAVIGCARRGARAGHRGFAAYCIASVAAMIVFLSLSSIGYARVPGLAEVSGLFERLSLMSGLLWMTVLAVCLSRGTRLSGATASGGSPASLASTS
jgi:hypothetical membrane protein